MDNHSPLDHLVSPSVAALPPWPRFQVNPDAHRLQWNENPFDFPADLKEIVLDRIAQREWSRYPLGLRAYDVIDRLAAYYGLPSESVVVGNGSSDLIRMVMSAALTPNDSVILPSPTFPIYRHFAALMGADIHDVQLPRGRDFALPVDEILNAASLNNAKVVVLCAPNNPTGTVFPLGDLRRVCEGVNALVLLDEAYGEFSGQETLALVSECPNVVSVRTMSKAFSMAGLRVGYALANVDVGRELQKLATPFTLNPFSETAAIVALDHADRFLAQAADLVRERDRVAASLEALDGVHVFSSGTNFLLFSVPIAPKSLCDRLAEEFNILLSPLDSEPQLQDCVRLSIGRPEENDILIATLGHLLDDMNL